MSSPATRIIQYHRVKSRERNDEGNAATINGHPAWAARWDLETNTATLLDVQSNTFCAGGIHAPNGSYIVFGGNSAIGPGGVGNGSNFNPVYGDFDGGQAVRVFDPCPANDTTCPFFDNASLLSMPSVRWYPGVESLPDGSAILIGGMHGGGFVNRNLPNVDPTFEGGGANPTYGFWPPKGPEQNMAFMTLTSGLNTYALSYTMQSGLLFVQANLSTILFNYTTNTEIPLPDMPNGVVRTYPASGANTLLPMTPANNYEATVIFCGGSALPADAYGDYSFPAVNTWEFPASNDCQRITPEPQDGSAPKYTQDDDMPQGRTMGQFIILPDFTLLMVNGAANGTAGYAQQTGQTPNFADMPFGESLSAGPVFQPAVYDPSKPPGQRWSQEGLSSSKIPRLYHSSALLMVDGSVMIAGGNPNIDVNLTTIFPTEYRLEIFYPLYWGKQRPSVTGMPSTLTYGGDGFDLVVDTNSYSGSANDAAANTTVVIIRPGWTTHGVNMGQRALQLNNTFSVSDSGNITVHVSQVPPNPAMFSPGPALMFVVTHGVPSMGKLIIVGNGQMGTQPTFDATVLPPSQLAASSVKGNASPNTNSSGSPAVSATSTHSLSTGVVVAIVVGGIAAALAVGVFIAVLVSRRRRARAATKSTIIGGIQRSASMGRAYRDAASPIGGQVGDYIAEGYKSRPSQQSTDGYGGYQPNEMQYGGGGRRGESFIPLQQYSTSDLHAPSTPGNYSESDVDLPIQSGYRDYPAQPSSSQGGGYGQYQPSQGYNPQRRF
ncbi:hypothetical protein Clacol_007227 [Clathrus columnatus]|uniref:Uncharacterized protein n=1 Tax=Clathrus columnatus TaxID=1419009 RepID=A0AAV5AJD9_9AGAM|nr:hypothetical protein Clacol_007227 [Clathrus columnatus]